MSPQNGKSSSLFCLIIGLIFFLIISPTNMGKVYSVKKKSQLKSLTEALTLCKSGDTIKVFEGTYTEGNIIILKPVTLLGNNNPVFSGEGEYEIITVKADNVIIDGFQFIDTGISFIHDNAAIKLDSVKNCVIRNNTFTNNFFSIYLARTSNSEILNNRISANHKQETYSGNGIHLWYCKNIHIEGNFVEGHRDGIYFEFVRSSVIKNNKSRLNLRYGLHFMFSDSCSYWDNLFEQNGAGVAVMYTKNVEMFRNNFKNNWGSASYGILLKEITDSKIYNNIFEKNTTAIYLEGCNRTQIESNEFVRNGWAIRLMANSMDNQFFKNNFLGNSFDVTTNNKKNYNLFENNFWSEYNGYDLDDDGIGDISYRPIKLYSILAEKNPPTLILLRSFFMGILDFAESIFPVITPETLADEKPSMNMFKIKFRI